ncbi:MAG TPA: response regulator transcription factor [Aggregatilineales bacterium]|nr:response regulator transcription factor [Aggregatilineales bacterium]
MGKQQTILIVEDETAIREVVRKYLELDRFAVLEATTGPQALDILGSQNVDLILLDIMLPGLDGFSIARLLRNDSGYSPLALNGKTPIIILTSRGQESDRLDGFELGADDYVVKPFSPRELVARVKAVLRRGGSLSEDDDKPLIFKELRIDPQRRSVARGTEAITLTAREFDLLWFLARHPQQVFTREQLLDKVWGYEFYGDDSTVTVHMRRLREKIEHDPSNPVFIQTVWGVGYKFEDS